MSGTTASISTSTTHPATSPSPPAMAAGGFSASMPPGNTASAPPHSAVDGRLPFDAASAQQAWSAPNTPFPCLFVSKYKQNGKNRSTPKDEHKPSPASDTHEVWQVWQNTAQVRHSTTQVRKRATQVRNKAAHLRATITSSAIYCRRYRIVLRTCDTTYSTCHTMCSSCHTMCSSCHTMCSSCRTGSSHCRTNDNQTTSACYHVAPATPTATPTTAPPKTLTPPVPH